MFVRVRWFVAGFAAGFVAAFALMAWDLHREIRDN